MNLRNDSYSSVINFIIKCSLWLFIVIIAFPVRFISRLIDAGFKVRLVAILFFLLFNGGTYHATAQGIKKFMSEYQVGLESSFGVKSFRLSSNIAEINNLRVIEEGGTVGIIVGAKAVIVKLRQGYYYSAPSVPYTIDEIRSSAIMNIYPLYFFDREACLRPYFLIGLKRDVFKMNGYYDHRSDSKKTNYASEAPYLGKISTIQTGFGGGMEYRVVNEKHFVAVFGEAVSSRSILRVSDKLFAGTRLSSQLAINVGVDFGYSR